MIGKAVKYTNSINDVKLGIIEDKIIAKDEKNSNLVTSRYLVSDNSGELTTVSPIKILRIIKMEEYLTYIEKHK